MKSKKLLLTFSIVIFILSTMLFFMSFMLTVGNASSVMALSLFSNMKTIYIMRFVSVCFFVFSILLFSLSMLNSKLKKEMNRSFAIILIIVFCVSIICSVLSVVLNYSSNSIYGYDTLENANYISLFPYYDDMIKSSNEIYTAIDESKIYSSKYVCLQSTCNIEDNTVLYDVNYFESKNNVLLGQFIVQNGINDSTIVDEGNYDNYTYCIYKNDISYTVTFESEESYFVLYLLNFDLISENEVTKTILDNSYSVMTTIKETQGTVLCVNKRNAAEENQSSVAFIF